jgi:hypothetical protein
MRWAFFARAVDCFAMWCVLAMLIIKPRETSMKKIIAVALLSFGLAGPAMAGQCPSIMAKIDEAMKTATLDDATKAKVTELYNKGKADHEAGNHDASVASLNEAMKLMGL